MWPTSHKNEFVSFIFYPQSLTCAWIRLSPKNKRAPLQMCAYTQFPLTELPLENGILYNPTILKKLMTTFLKTHKQQNASISFCLSDPTITQHYATLPTANPTKENFAPNVTHAHVWNYHFMYQHDGNSTFYTYAVPRLLILQHQLLAIGAQLDLIRITTTESALFYVYKYIYSTAFRRTQLALDMIKHKNKLERLITPDMIQRVIQLPAGYISQQELIPIATSCGLFMLDKEQL